MKTIYKFVFEPQDNFTLQLPRGAKILSVQVQNEVPCLWALVDNEEKLETREFWTRGTGHNCDELFYGNELYRDIEFLGTFQMLGGKLVFHLFVKR